MEEIFKFIEKHWILSIIIILGMLAPGIVFIFLWDADMFWTEDTVKVLLLSSGIMCTVYVYNFILLYIGYLMKPIEESIYNMGTGKLLFPVICAIAELGVAVYLKLFSPFGVVVTIEVGIQIVFLVSIFIQILYTLVLEIKLNRNKEEIEKYIGKKFSNNREFLDFLKLFSDKLDEQKKE